MTPDELARMIPPEVVEAAARAMCQRYYAHILSLNWEEQLDEPYWREQARAALAAGLANWPDSILMPAELILPLPQEKPNDKA